MSAAVDIAEIIEAEGFGTLWATTGWSVQVAQEPHNPNTCITVYDTQGSQPHYFTEWERPSVQVRVRGEPGAGYTDAMDKAQNIKRFFAYGEAVSINGSDYLCWVESEVAWLKHDENNRPIFAFNLRLLRSDS